MKNLLLALCILASALSMRSQSFTVTVNPSICFNPNSTSANSLTAVVTTTSTSTITHYVWNILSTTFSTCVGSYTSTSGSTATSIVAWFPCCGAYSVMATAYNGTAIVGAYYGITTAYCNQVTSPENFISCGGTSVTMLASGGGTVSWTDGSNTISTSSVAVVSPTANTCYTVSGTNPSGCTYSSVACVTVVNTPTVSVTGAGSSTANCQWTTYTLNASGAANYTWYPSLLGTGSSKVVYIYPGQCYTVVGSNGGLCTSSAVICPSVTPSPTIAITASPSQTVCPGTTVTLTPSPSQIFYTWSAYSGTLSNSPTIAVTPTTGSSSYTLSFTASNGCNGYATVDIDWAPQNPNVSVIGNTVLCAGQSRTLTTNSSGPWSWSDGNSVISTASTAVVSPTGSTCYMLTATASAACTNTQTICLTVGATPNLTVTGGLACTSSGGYIYATGATFYSIPSQSATSSNYIYVSPSSSTCYTVSGWNTTGCTATAVACMTVVPPPVYSGTSSVKTICAGESVTLATSSTSHTWGVHYGVGTFTGTSLVLTPTATTFYSVDVDWVPCYTGFATTVIVVQPPSISISGSSTLCAGGSLNLSASGANTYTWSNASTANNIAVSPASSTCYTVTGSNPQGCMASAVHCVSVFTTPVLLSPSSATVCRGTSFTFTASGASGYVWSNSTTTDTMNATPLVTTSYSVSGTGVNNCPAVAVLVVDTTCSDVWPGDANSDGVVGTSDVLEIGLAYNATGSARSPGGNSFVSQHASNWSGTVSSGKNKCHADCNGDGTIDDDDTLAIYNNFSMTHGFKSSGNGNDIRVVTDEQHFMAGTWNKVDIYVGDGQNNVSIYGLTFDLGFDNTLLENGEAYLVFTPSFLNNNNQNLLFRKGDFNSGKIYSAAVRTDYTNVSGTGKIAELHFKIKPATEGQFMDLSVNNSERVDKDGNFTAQSGNNLSVLIWYNDVGIREENKAVKLSLVPNPASDQVTLRMSENIHSNYVITDISGRKLIEGQFSGTATIDTSHLPAGVYLVTCNQANVGSAGMKNTQRLVIQR